MIRTPQEWLEEDNLTEALAAARRAVEERPDDAGMRFMLFELFVLEEDFGQAARHLSALPPSYAQAKAHYGGILSAEKRRREVLLNATGRPSFLKRPPLHVQTFLSTLRALVRGELDDPHETLQSLQRPTRSGRMDGEVFVDLRDCDDLLAPVLEFVVPGAYGWLPISQVKSIQLLPPQGYPDVIWVPAHVRLRDSEQEQLVRIPALYVGTGARSDAEKLGNETRWERPLEGLSRAFGQRDLVIEDADGRRTLRGIRDIHEILFD